MNTVNLVGRLTRDPDIRWTQGENASCIARFTVAVNRRFKNKQTNEYEADFPGCVAFGKTAEFIQKYFSKGSMIGIQGEIRTNNFTNKEGVKVYTTEVAVNNVEFVGSKSDNNSGGSTKASAPPPDDGFVNVPEGIDEELPFN